MKTHGEAIGPFPTWIVTSQCLLASLASRHYIERDDTVDKPESTITRNSPQIDEWLLILHAYFMLRCVLTFRSSLISWSIFILPMILWFYPLSVRAWSQQITARCNIILGYSVAHFPYPQIQIIHCRLPLTIAFTSVLLQTCMDIVRNVQDGPEWKVVLFKAKIMGRNNELSSAKCQRISVSRLIESDVSIEWQAGRSLQFNVLATDSTTYSISFVLAALTALGGIRLCLPSTILDKLIKLPTSTRYGPTLTVSASNWGYAYGQQLAPSCDWLSCELWEQCVS